MPFCRFLLLMTLAAVWTGCGPADTSTSAALARRADEPRYFMSLYGYQGRGRLNLPRRSHTWAVFARFDGQDLARANVDQFAISWLAADADIGILQGVEPGHNFSHRQTMAIAASLPVTVQRTPFVEIDTVMFDAAVTRHTALTNGAASGTIRYKMIDDMAGRQRVLSGYAGGYTNCIHGVSDMVAAHAGLLDTGTLRGFDASHAVFDWLRRTGHVVDAHGANDGIVAQRLTAP